MPLLPPLTVCAHGFCAGGAGNLLGRRPTRGDANEQKRFLYERQRLATALLYSLPPLAAKKVTQAKSHLYFVKEGNNAIVLVSPNDRRVADVIH